MKNQENAVLVNMYKMGLDYAKAWEMLPTLLTLARLAKKHHKLAEIACNGEGYIRGRAYTCGVKSDNVSSAYVSEDRTIFDVESEKVEAKIESICKRIGLRVEFQGDPRGYTCKFYFGERFLDIQG